MIKARTAILISGRGSNMEALVRASQHEDYPASINLVLSNRPEAAGLVFASDHDIPAIAVDHKIYPDRQAFEQELDRVLRVHNIEWICLAGFMRVLTPWFVSRWQERIINIHPSLLPLFKGTNTHQQALNAGVKVHGCTVHFVVPELDSGPIIAQASIPVHEGETPSTLAARVLKQEHKLYPSAFAEAVSKASSS
jgi:phosphoribosylglycinamide formyltransferase 1